MRDHGIVEFRAEELTGMPYGWRNMARKPRIRALAASIKKVGLIHPPTVRKDSLEPICGLDRIVACWFAQRTMACRVVSGTDEEMEALRRDENKHRRDTTEERDRTLLHRLDERAEALGSRAAAHREIAAEEDVQPEAVRRREFRAKKRAKDTVRREQAPPPLESWGIELTKEQMAKLRATDNGWRSCRNALTAAGRALEMTTHSGMMASKRYRKIRVELAPVHKMIVESTPVAVCPACKLVPYIQESCRACYGVGVVTKKALAGIPDALKKPGVALYEKRLVSLEEV